MRTNQFQPQIYASVLLTNTNKINAALELT